MTDPALTPATAPTAPTATTAPTVPGGAPQAGPSGPAGADTDPRRPLAPVQALGAGVPGQARIGALELRLRDDIALASLALPRGAAAPDPFGLELPRPGGWAGDGELGAVWAAPGQWLILSRGPTEAAGHDATLAARLGAAVPGGYVTEQSDTLAVFEIRAPDGTALVTCIERLANLPRSALAPGRGTRSLVGHMGMYLIRLDEAVLRVVSLRSAVKSVWHDLCRALHVQDALGRD